MEKTLREILKMGDALYTQGHTKAAPISNEKAAQEYGNKHAKLFSDWYVFRQGRFWCLANILAASCAASFIAEKMNTALLASWGIFIFLNAILLLNVITNNRDDKMSGSQRDDTFIFFAAIFGGAWGGLLFFAGQYLDQPDHFGIQLIVLAIAGTAMPIFALHKGAFTIFSLTLLVPGVAAHLHLDNVNLSIFFIALAIVYVSAAYLAATERTLASIMVKFLGLGLGHHKAPLRDLPKESFIGLADKRIRKITRQLPGQTPAKSSLDAVGDGIITVDNRGFIEYMNPTAEVMLGIPFKGALGEDINTLLNLKDRDTQNYLAKIISDSNSETEQRRRSEETLIRNDGIAYQIELIALPLRDELDKLDSVSFVLRELTNAQPLADERSWKTGHDPLTHLLNRIEFEKRLGALFNLTSDNNDQSHAICVIDLDNFRYLNETLGYRGGDKALTTLAHELKAKIRGADVLARIGDNKFGVLLYACKHDKARMIAEGLRRIAEQTNLAHEDNSARLTVSIGIVAFNPKNDSLTDVLVSADAACISAKQEGGNRVFTILSDDPSKRAVSEEISNLKKIQSALQNNDLVLQTRCIRRATPQLNGVSNLSKKDTDRQCEILLRMESEHGKLTAPRESLAAAKRFQIMPELDRWATKATLDAVRLGHPTMLDMQTVFINISGQSLNDDDFIDFLIEELDDENLATESLCFEISHASLISSIERTAQFIAHIKEYDCKISLRDIGFNNDALSLLKCLHIDFLKIDPRFVRNMIHNSIDYEIVLAFIRIAKSMGVQTIAEGVGTAALKEALTGMGIDYLQGMLIGEPQPIETRRIRPVSRPASAN